MHIRRKLQKCQNFDIPCVMVVETCTKVLQTVVLDVTKPVPLFVNLQQPKHHPQKCENSRIRHVMFRNKDLLLLGSKHDNPNNSRVYCCILCVLSARLLANSLSQSETCGHTFLKRVDTLSWGKIVKYRISEVCHICSLDDTLRYRVKCPHS